MAKMYRVYSIIERPKQDDFWLNIGVAFPHDDGKGFNVLLQALPLHGGGKIVLREHDPDREEETDHEPRRRSDNGGRDRQRGDRDEGSRRQQR